MSGSFDMSVRVWDVSTDVELKELRGHTGLVSSVAFSSDGRWVVSGSSDKSVRVWDVSMIGCVHFDWNMAENNWIISSQGQDPLMCHKRPICFNVSMSSSFLTPDMLLLTFISP